jgi:hypothetical protein
MIDEERPWFGAAEVIEIASKFGVADDTFIIGGQATNFWAWFFQEREPELNRDSQLKRMVANIEGRRARRR